MRLQLRRLPSDDDYVTRRLSVLEEWGVSGEMAPWIVVLIAEWVRSTGGRDGSAPTMHDLQSLLLDPRMVEVMREQADDGPWAVYQDQARGVRSNDAVMTYLSELQVALAK